MKGIGKREVGSMMIPGKARKGKRIENTKANPVNQKVDRSQANIESIGENQRVCQMSLILLLFRQAKHYDRFICPLELLHEVTYVNSEFGLKSKRHDVKCNV
mmetsp:Transcript_12970/g.19445  ORF Transcript_12970/g.19445 Transcript_12970/m.19445 type:complete len:102 (+) Transcript_12970:912-1217(+)